MNQESVNSEHNQLDRRALIAGIGGLAAGATLFAGTAKAGPLTPPPGPIGSTGRTVQEIYDKIARTDAGLAEPRIPVQSLPGSATALHVISQPGSYYLTGNIIGEPGKNGIEISADSVTLDLAGHQLVGVAGSLSGVRVAGFGRVNTVVRNGTVSDWPDDGVNANDAVSCMVKSMLIARCNRGVIVRDAGCVRDCVMKNLTGIGVLLAGNPGMAACCVFRECGEGVVSENRGSILDCNLFGAGVGFRLYNGGLIRGCSVSSCVVGYSVRRGHLIESHAFDCQISAEALGGARVEAVSVGHPLGGATTGIAASETSALVIRCSVSGSGTPYAIAPGNSHGPIIDITGVGDIASVPGADHPWANLIH